MKIVNDLVCPRCKGTKWQMGPRGGAAQNIRCVCGYELNVTKLPDGRFWVEDITARRMKGGDAKQLTNIKEIISGNNPV